MKKQNIFLVAGIVLAVILWYVMFVIRPFNFWLMMSFSTGLLSILTFFVMGRLWQRAEWNGRNILLGIASALLLWGVFWIGNHILIFISDIFPELPLQRAENINSVYANRGALSRYVVAALLFFPIGFGEEVFWRGFVQSSLQNKIKPLYAWLLATFLYMAVHIATGNPILLIAALVCGLFWGWMYWKTGSLVPVLISHMLWDPLIFIILPII